MLSVLQKWLDDHDHEEIKVEYGEEFEYSILEDVITVATVLPSYDYEEFERFALSRGLELNPGPWVLAFLHEVGHAITLLDDSLDEHIDSYFETRDRMRLADYMAHPVEASATDWAVDYINNNKEEIIQLIKDIDEKMNSKVLEVYVNGTKMEAC